MALTINFPDNTSELRIGRAFARFHGMSNWDTAAPLDIRIFVKKILIDQFIETDRWSREQDLVKPSPDRTLVIED